MNDIGEHFYRIHPHSDTRSRKNKQVSLENHHHPNSREIDDFMDKEDIQELKKDNAKLKKLLKETQAKRTLITKECSEALKKIEKLQQENTKLARKIKDGNQTREGSQFRLDELKFLNKELNNENQELRRDNEDLSEKLRYHTEILERKYEELEERALKRIQQAIKRVKKGLHYVSTLTGKQFEKTRDIQIENMKKTIEVLKGKHSDDNYEEEIQEMMNPIRNIQEELHQKHKQLVAVKQKNIRLEQEVQRHKKIENQLMPQYKQSIEKLKKGLVMMRGQLSENQFEKCQLKKKYEEKIKEIQIRYDQVFRQHRKLKLENKIYEKKVEEMEFDIQEEKQRLIGENQMLKKLYHNHEEHEMSDEQDNIYEDRTEGISYKTTTNFRKHQLTDIEGEEIPSVKERRSLKKNYSTRDLHPSKKIGLAENSSSRLKLNGSSKRNYEHLRHDAVKQKANKKALELSDEYYEENDTSQLSQESLKNQIFKIDQEIMEIQKTLNHELQMYK